MTQRSRCTARFSANKWLKPGVLACGLGGIFSASAAFQVVALGVQGGVEEGNLTSYLIRSDGQKSILRWMPVPYCRASARR